MDEVTAFLNKQNNVSTETTNTTEQTQTEQQKPAAEAQTTTQTTTDTTAATEQTQAAVADQEKSFFDSLPETLKPETSTQATTQDAKQPEIPKETLAEIESLKSELAKAKSNPLLQTLEKFGQVEGFDLKKFAKEYIGEDFTKMSYQDLIAKDLRDKGFAEDKITAAIEEIVSGKSEIQQELHELELRKSLQSAQKPSDYIKSLEEAAQKFQPVDVKAQQEEMQKIYQADLTSISTLAKSLKDQDVFGLKVDDAQIDDIIKSYDNLYQSPYVNKDNTFNTKQFVVDTYKLKNFDKIVQAAIEFGKNSVKRESTNIDRTGNSGQAAPASDQRTVYEKLRDSINTR